MPYYFLVYTVYFITFFYVLLSFMLMISDYKILFSIKAVIIQSSRGHSYLVIYEINDL
ncbi:hypothetical protein C1646_725460 [Rhizophagus diaphanus]|nr:hypothetical protein C1646_725460 [Rhizophagus diaphanus] [Rhizophagus sp. MUCL 43196]